MGTRRNFEFDCGNIWRAAATDTLMPQRTRVNGFVARRLMSKHREAFGRLSPRLDKRSPGAFVHRHLGDG